MAAVLGLEVNAAIDAMRRRVERALLPFVREVVVVKPLEERPMREPAAKDIEHHCAAFAQRTVAAP